LPGQGDWVINLASYTSPAFVRKKQAEFVRAGVTVEQAQAVVKGRTVYRLRVPGFETFEAASARAAGIRAQPGLRDTWITRH
jgi:hypothetical protein